MGGDGCLLGRGGGVWKKVRPAGERGRGGTLAKHAVPKTGGESGEVDEGREREGEGPGGSARREELRGVG